MIDASGAKLRYEALTPIAVAFVAVALTFGVQRALCIDEEHMRIGGAWTKASSARAPQEINLSLQDPIHDAELRLRTFVSRVSERGPQVVAHLLWGLACLLLLIVLLGAMGSSITMIMKPPAPRSTDELLTLRVAGALLFGGMVLTMVITAFDFGPGSFDEIPRLVDDSTGLPITGTTMLLTVLAVLTVGGLLLASCSTLARTPMAVGQLSTAAMRLRQLLYWGGACCVAGVFEVFLLFRWPAALVPRSVSDVPVESLDAARDSITQVALTYSFAAGALFTLVLCAVYGPPAVSMNRWARNMARRTFAQERINEGTPREPTSGDIAAWLREHGLHVSWMQISSQLLAAASPIVAGGPIAALLSRLLE